MQNEKVVIPPYLQRLEDELGYISEKQGALLNFLSSDFFQSLSERKRSLLQKQNDAMVDYLKILQTRYCEELREFKSKK